MFFVDVLLVYLNQEEVLYVSNTTIEHVSKNEITTDELSELIKQQGFIFQDLLVYSNGELNPCQLLQNILLPDKKSLIIIFKKKTNRFTRKSKCRLNQSILPIQSIPLC